MTAKCHLRGHPIEWDALRQRWTYCDTLEPIAGNERPCERCGQHGTPEGHDACLGTLAGVTNACCGHGDDDNAYVQRPDGSVARGRDAVQEMSNMADRKEASVSDSDPTITAGWPPTGGRWCRTSWDHRLLRTTT